MVVCAATSPNGSSEFVLEGKQNSSKYTETLNQYVFLLCDKFRDEAVIFQHDNTKKFLQRNLKVLKRPAHSPDFEHH